MTLKQQIEKEAQTDLSKTEMELEGDYPDDVRLIQAILTIAKRNETK